MILAVNFTLEELERSATAVRLGIDNQTPSNMLGNVAWLVAAVLQPIRTRIGKPMFVLGGFRCPALNAKVGGADDSDHMKGLGADFAFDPSVTSDEVATAMAGLPIRIAIYYPDQGRWHVSASPDRGQPKNAIRTMGPLGVLVPFYEVNQV